MKQIEDFFKKYNSENSEILQITIKNSDGRQIQQPLYMKKEIVLKLLKEKKATYVKTDGYDLKISIDNKEFTFSFDNFHLSTTFNI